MKLIEQGRGLTMSSYLADNIEDLKRSRSEVLSSVDSHFKWFSGHYDDPSNPYHLSPGHSEYYYRFGVYLPKVNHEPDRDSEFFGLNLYDGSGSINAKIPNWFARFLYKIQGGKNPDYQYLKNNIWLQRPVTLVVVYDHQPYSITHEHKVDYELYGVDNLPRFKGAAQPEFQKSTALEGAFAS